jgi:hypothetical protein
MTTAAAVKPPKLDTWARISSFLPTLALVGLAGLSQAGFVDFKRLFWPTLGISLTPIALVGLVWWVGVFVDRFMRALRLSWLLAVSVILVMVVGGALIGAVFTVALFRTYVGWGWVDTGIGVDRIGDVVVTRLRARALGSMLSVLLLASPLIVAVIAAYWINVGLLRMLRHSLAPRLTTMIDDTTITPWDVVGHALFMATLVGAALAVWAEYVALVV